MDVMASTMDAKLGTAVHNITVFQEFFIEPDIPVSAVRGDEFELPVLIYNYESTARDVTVQLDDAEWFELLSPSTRHAHVSANSVSSVRFRINATRVGEHELSVKASNGIKNDWVLKKMRVEPDGKAVEQVTNGELSDNQTAFVDLTLSPQRVPNSEDAYVKIHGSMESILIDGAENYIVFVSGCGEQSTSRLSVDILAYRNLLKGNPTDEQMFKYESIIIQGIQHEFMYLIDAPSGRAICWHTSNKKPDSWLTAWALFALSDLKNTDFEIDENVIEDIQTYLISIQRSDGSYKFPNVGHWSINSDLRDKELPATAYITRALLYSDHPKDSTAIQRTCEYIQDHIDTEESAFTLALCLAALEDAEWTYSVRAAIAERLVDLRMEDEDGNVYWSRVSHGQCGYGGRTIETTGYAIIALSKHG